jgi:putative peptidoglycan binding protein
MRMSAALAALAATTLGAVGARGADLTLPKGTAFEVRTETPLSAATAKKGDTFQARTRNALWVDGRLAIPAGSLVSGEVKVVKSPREGAKSAALAIKFEDLTVGGHRYDIEGVLTSLKHDDRTKILELYPKLTTGRKVDVILIGSGTEPTRRVSTLVGLSGEGREDLADEWGTSGLGPATLDVDPGTFLAVQLDAPVTVEASTGAARGRDDRVIFVNAATVKAAQEALKARANYSGPITGELDQATRNALARFQIDQKQPASGDADEATLRALGVTLPAAR